MSKADKDYAWTIAVQLVLDETTISSEISFLSSKEESAERQVIKKEAYDNLSNLSKNVVNKILFDDDFIEEVSTPVRKTISKRKLMERLALKPAERKKLERELKNFLQVICK